MVDEYGNGQPYLDNPEADVHARAHGLVWNNAVDIRVSLQSLVDLACLPLSNSLLSVDLVGEVIQELLDDLTGNIYAEDVLVGQLR